MRIGLSLLVSTALLASSLGGCDSESSLTSPPLDATGGASASGGASTTGGGSDGGSSSLGGGGTGGVGGSGGDVVPDPCLVAQPVCPVPPSGSSSGSGLVPVDRCAFPIEEQGFDTGAASAVAQLAQALTPRSIADVLGDLNRDATTESSVPGNPVGVVQAFGWNGGDQNVDYWIPQGLTGSADASANGLVAGRELVLASWYYDMPSDPSSNGEKGVRVSLADVTDPASVSYRHLLLVEPALVAGQVDFLPVTIHAGGIAWVDDYLYVADTVHGFRVFDMSRIAQVATGKSGIGFDAADGLHYAGNYKYVVPQIGRYERQGDCEPRFSFVALDRSTTPPSLVSGEYDSNSLFGRLLHWPMFSDAKLGPARSFPSGVFFSMHSHLQGGVSYGGTHWLSSSEPPAGQGDLYVAAEGAPSQVVSWVDAPEDLMLDAPRAKLWSQSEGDGARYVFAVSPLP